jgi:hypothetical protein
MAAVPGVNQQSTHKFRAMRRRLIHRECYFFMIALATHAATRRNCRGTFWRFGIFIAEGSAARTQA